MADFFIGEIATRLGVSAKAIRHYESLGLLGTPRRTDAGYRVYGEDDEARLRFVLGAKALGLALAEIKEIVGVWGAGERPCGQVSRLLDEKLAGLDRRIEELTRFRDELRAYKAQVDAAGAASDVPCGHVDGVAQGRWVPPPSSEPTFFQQAGG